MDIENVMLTGKTKPSFFSKTILLVFALHIVCHIFLKDMFESSNFGRRNNVAAGGVILSDTSAQEPD